MHKQASRLICVVVVIAASFLLPHASSSAAATGIRRVLIINDLGIMSSPGFAELDQAVLTGLQKSPYRIELYEESLDFTLFPDRVSQDRFKEEIIQKYSARKPDVIIAAGPASLKFIANLYDKFKGTPIIFCAIWEGIPDQLRQGMPFTGVLAQLHAGGTLNAALHLLPSTKHVVVVGGVGTFDEGFEAIAKEGLHNYESKLEFTYLFDLTMPALLARLKHLPGDTIVYHTSITQDAAGDRFIDSAQSIPMVASAANAPVFVMDDVDLRAGTVGGDLVNWADDGRIAAEMAVRVLNGEKPQDIPVVTSNHVYMFDWRALKRWGMNERDLPPGSIVLNHEPTVWESYKVIHRWRVFSDASGSATDFRAATAAGSSKKGGSRISNFVRTASHGSRSRSVYGMGFRTQEWRKSVVRRFATLIRDSIGQLHRAERRVLQSRTRGRSRSCLATD